MTRTPHKPWKVGDQISFTYGTYDVLGQIIEDRGPIGVGGRRLLRVLVRLDPSLDPTVFEIPEALARPASA